MSAKSQVEAEWAAAEKAFADLEADLDSQPLVGQADSSVAAARKVRDRKRPQEDRSGLRAAKRARGSGASALPKRRAPKSRADASKRPKSASASAAGTSAISARRLKQYAGKSKTEPVPITVGLTGARAGDMLNGCSEDTANVVLRIDTGTIAAPLIIRKSVEHEVGRDNVIAAVAKHFGIASTAAAEMRYDDCPVSEQPNHAPLGQGCSHTVAADGKSCECKPAARFTILNQGVWQQFADEHGHGQTLEAMVSERRSVCYRDVLSLMHTPGQPGGKLLILRPRLYKIVPGPEALTVNDPRLTAPDAVVIDATTLVAPSSSHASAQQPAVSSTSIVVEIEGRLLKLPSPGLSKLRRDQVPGVVIGALQGILAAEDQATWLVPKKIEQCAVALRPLSVGGLKSLLQKTIRFRPATVELFLTQQSQHPDLNSKSGVAALGCRPPAALVAAVAAVLLFCEAGVFSPELQLYTRGSTSALKRTAVTLVEDAWVEGAEQDLQALMCLALATQRMPDYEPSRHVVLATARLAAKAVESPSLVAWRAEKNTVVGQSRQRKEKKIAVKSDDVKALVHSWELLSLVKSFQSDIEMLEKVARVARKVQELKLLQVDDGGDGCRMETMPVYHLVDQHTYRGIGHIGPTSGRTFAERFASIFDRTTGFNPRLQSISGFEDQPIVKETRFAQLCCAKLVFKCPRRQLKRVGSATARGSDKDAEAKERAQQGMQELELRLDSGILAAAVGPIPVQVKVDKGRSRDALVMLGVRCPEDEVVMLKPARATRDLFGTLSDAERAAAIAHARSRTDLSARSPMLDGTNTVKYEDDCWKLNGEPWATFVGRARVLNAAIVEAPEWAVTDQTKLAAVLKSDGALADALSVVGEGLAANAEMVIKGLVGASADAVALRAVSMMRQQYVQVGLPTPALNGGIGSDQLAAYSGDWDVYRLLALLSRLAPGALRPQIPPTFAVIDANLLRIVERWILQALRTRPSSAATPVRQSSSLSHSSALTSPTTTWANHPSWRKMSSIESRLMEHQRAAVSSMHRRDDGADTGHFLIMDTGVGKTVTSLCYLYRWLVKHGGDATRRILWVTPAGTVDNLIDQLQRTWSAPVWQVPRVSTAQKPKEGDVRRLILKDFHINVIHADHLRVAIDNGLAEQAPYSVICFDEVDEMYAPTLRTSAARRLAQLTPKFVAQTATPMRKNESQLLAWLTDTCSFPVDNKNLLVAASGMVSIQLELGIEGIENLLLIPMVDDVRLTCRKLATQREWLKMARLVQSHTDKTMVGKAISMAQADRTTHPSGGVLLIADNAEHAATLIKLCDRSAAGSGGRGNRTRIKTGNFSSLEAPNAADYGIVVVTKDKDRGYNSACRLGAMVTGAYAGNGASRHQIRGRLRRLGQVRKSVNFTTVVMENSILHLLHKRHNAVDSMNISLQQLGDTFSTDVLRALNCGE